MYQTLASIILKQATTRDEGGCIVACGLILVIIAGLVLGCIIVSWFGGSEGDGGWFGSD